MIAYLCDRTIRLEAWRMGWSPRRLVVDTRWSQVGCRLRWDKALLLCAREARGITHTVPMCMCDFKTDARVQRELAFIKNISRWLLL